MGLVRFFHRFLVRQTMPAAAVNYYGRMCDAAGPFYLKPLSEEINREFAQGIHILDVGTGLGHLPVLLAQENPRHHITALDLSPACIRAARARALQAGVDARVRFVRDEVSALQGKFDLVVSTCSLHHWRHPAQVLKNMAGLLNAAGQIWLLDDSCDVSEEDRSMWVRKVESAFDAGILFRTVFNFESRHLAYREAEIRSLCDQAALQISSFRIRDVFFLVKCRPLIALGTQE